MFRRIVTRLLASLFLFVFAFGVCSCRHAQEIRLFPNVHVVVREDSWVQKIDYVSRLVTVNPIGTKTEIVFKAEPELILFLQPRLNWIAPVTFYCNGKPDKNCDLKKPYELYVATRKVKLVRIENN